MKKIALLALVLVLTVGALGVGYAAWRDTITIDGTVSTGTVCVEFTSGAPYMLDSVPPSSYVAEYDVPGAPTYAPHDDSEGLLTPDLVPPSYFPDKTAYPDVLGDITIQDKNVAWGGVYVDPADSKLLHVALRNVYPWYFNELDFRIYNCGNVPVKLERIIVTVPGADPEQVYYLEDNGDVIQLDLDGNDVMDFELAWIEDAPLGYQMEGGDHWDVSMPFLVLQDEGDTIQGGDFNFDITFEWIQWNEYEGPTGQG